MAEITTTRLLDDLARLNGEGDVDAAETVSFAVDGASYEIDLSAEHAADLRASFAEYIPAARKAAAKASSTKRPRKAGGKSGSTALNLAIREWGVQKGLMEAGKRGAIPKAVKEGYLAENPQAPAAPVEVETIPA